MSKSILLSVVFAVALLSASTVFAGIFNTPHNLSSVQIGSTDPYVDTNEDQVCIFCHTPHGGTLDAPLWNRDMTTLQGAGKFTHYSSAFLVSLGYASNRAVNNESLTCLSCHDGSIAVGDSLINNSGTVPSLATTKIQLPPTPNPGPRIGSSRALRSAGNDTTTFDLSDDHPISVSYNTVLGSAKAAEFQPVATAEGNGLTLFGAAENVECATCHDPHVDYILNPQFTPFLAMSNANSAMCLSCHKK